MSFLTEEKVEFTDPNDMSPEKQIGRFVEFTVSDSAGVYAIILKNDGAVALIPIYNIKFIEAR
jgi:hypothetical protein